jgi:hypothetical protein
LSVDRPHVLLIHFATKTNVNIIETCHKGRNHAQREKRKETEKSDLDSQFDAFPDKTDCGCKNRCMDIIISSGVAFRSFRDFDVLFYNNYSTLA